MAQTLDPTSVDWVPKGSLAPYLPPIRSKANKGIVPLPHSTFFKTAPPLNSSRYAEILLKQSFPLKFRVKNKTLIACLSEHKPAQVRPRTMQARRNRQTKKVFQHSESIDRHLDKPA